jgi:transposase-like protein/IS1 family transposase
LEKLRWAGNPVCPHCESDKVYERETRKHFFHCNNCNNDFTVLFGTIFEGTKMPLPKWFLLVGMMLNARKGISAMEISRHLGVTYKTAWYSAMRVRCAMIDQVDMLEGILEMDEAYLGGKPRHRNAPDNKATLSNLTLAPKVSKRGRGTSKVAVIGIVEREGKKRVVTEVAGKLNSTEMLKLLKKYVNEEKAVMMTDDARFYKKFEDKLQHLIINHSKKQYVDGEIHTNTIEGFWSIIKNGLRGEYHVLSRKYLPFYLAEFTYKYNRRSKEDKLEAFNETITKSVTDDKCLIEYKPKGDVHEIAYGKKKGTQASPKPVHKIVYKKVLSKKDYEACETMAKQFRERRKLVQKYKARKKI